MLWFCGGKRNNRMRSLMAAASSHHRQVEIYYIFICTEIHLVTRVLLGSPFLSSHVFVPQFIPQLRVRDFTKLAVSPVFGITKAEKAAKGGTVGAGESGGVDGREASTAGGGGLTLRDYQLEVGWREDWSRVVL